MVMSVSLAASVDEVGERLPGGLHGLRLGRQAVADPGDDVLGAVEGGVGELKELVIINCSEVEIKASHACLPPDTPS